MFDILILTLAIISIYGILIGITSVVVLVLEHLYFTCKPTYHFTDYIPNNVAGFILWPLILPLLLLEIIYIATYCLTQKLRKLL
jgi:hypothetical protein